MEADETLGLDFAECPHRRIGRNRQQLMTVPWPHGLDEQVEPTIAQFTGW